MRIGGCLQGEQRLAREQVVELSSALASETWDAEDLPGEAPIELLHLESSGWSGSEPDSERIPWLILAADVLDCVTLLMGTGDLLILEGQA